MMTHKSTPIILALLALSVSLALYFTLSRPQIVTWDEAGFILDGYRVSQAVRHFDLTNFYWLTKNQFYYPFFQSWFLGFATLPFEYTINSARLTSSLLLIPTVLLLWLIGERVKSKNCLIKLMPVALTLTSPLILFYFSNVMKEGLGLVLTLLTVWLYLLARDRKRWFLFALTGFSLLLLTLTKYYYGLLALFPIGFETLIWAFQKPFFRSQKFFLHHLSLFLPLAFGLTYWLLPLYRARWFWQILSNNYQWQVNLYDTTLLGHLSYYPQELATSYTFSPFLFPLLLFGFAFALRHFRLLPVRLLSLFFLFNFFLAERYISNNQARYIFISVPSFFLLASFGLTQATPYFCRFLHRSFVLGFISPFLAVIAFLSFKDLIQLPSLIKPTASHQLETAVFYEQDFQNINRYDFNRSHWPKVPPPPGAPTIDTVFEFILSEVNPRQPVTLVGQLSELSPGLFTFQIEKARLHPTPTDNRYQEYFVTLEISPGTRFDTKDYRQFNRQTEAQIANTLQDKALARIASRTFPYLGLKITILGRPYP